MSAQELFCLSRFNDLLLTEPTNEHDDDDHLGPRGLPPSLSPSLTFSLTFVVTQGLHFSFGRPS